MRLPVEAELVVHRLGGMSSPPKCPTKVRITPE